MFQVRIRALGCTTAALALALPAVAMAQEAAPTPQEQAAPAQSPESGPAPVQPKVQGMAPEAQSPNAGVLQDIVVTATRTATNLQNTPIAVTALSSESLKQRNVASLIDVANFVPSLSIGSRSGTGIAGGGISIRGMGVDATASSAAVGIYIDDVFFASDRGNILGLLDVERLEVLRGPQGTLFGRNTIAGAIQYVTRQPDSQLGGYVTGILGNIDRRSVQGALNLPITDTLALRVSGIYDHRGGYVHDILNDKDLGSETVQAGRMKLRWTPTERLTVDLKGEIAEQSTNGRPVVVTGVNPNAQFAALANLIGGETRTLNSSYISPGKYTSAGFNAADFFDFHYYVAQGAIAYQLTDTITIKSITARSWSKYKFAQDFDDTPLAILSSYIPSNKLDVFTQELQLSGKALDDSLKFTLGGYYFDSEEKQVPGRLLGIGLLPAAAIAGSPRTDITSKALYGQATYNITEALSASAGLRYSSERNKSSLIGQTTPTPVTFKNWSPHFGLNLQITPDILLYAKASRGFRAGGVTPNAALPGQQLAFSPETAWTYEVGARMQFLDRRLRINPTIFYTKWKDIQFNRLLTTPSGPAAVTDNAGDATIKGFELESQFAVTDRLQLTGTLSLLDGKYTRVAGLTYNQFPLGFALVPGVGPVPRSVVVVPNITTDTSLQRTPKTKFSLGGRYTLPLGASALVGSLDYAWTAKQQSAVTIADRLTLPSYGVLNGRLQFNAANGNVSVAIFGTNLTNKYYLVGGVDFAKGYTSGVTEQDPARPREFGGEVTFRF